MTTVPTQTDGLTHERRAHALSVPAEPLSVYFSHDTKSAAFHQVCGAYFPLRGIPSPPLCTAETVCESAGGKIHKKGTGILAGKIRENNPFTLALERKK